MNLKDTLEAFKSKNKDTVEFTFRNGTKFKGVTEYRLHRWLDQLYEDAVSEYKINKTQNIVGFIKSLL